MSNATSETADAPDIDNAGLAFGLVIAAGLSTAIGAAAVFNLRLVKLASKPVLAAGLGFAGGVMLYVSFVEIFVKSQGSFADHGMEEKTSYLCATLCFFAGMVLLRIISFLVHLIDANHHAYHTDSIDEVIDNVQAGEVQPATVDPAAEGQAQPQAIGAADAENPQPNKEETKMTAAEAKEAKEKADARKLSAMGLNTAAAIGIHNFPEGLATFVATLSDPNVGITLAIAIGIHNIPEGLCVALPIFYATGSRIRGFLWALLSGISEPIGALIGYAIIKSTGEDLNLVVYGILFGVVAGMMVMIVVLELLPTAYRYDTQDKVVTSFVGLGMLVMAASLVLFQL